MNKEQLSALILYGSLMRNPGQWPDRGAGKPCIAAWSRLASVSSRRIVLFVLRTLEFSYPDVRCQRSGTEPSSK